MTTENWNLLGHEWAVDMLRRHVAQGEARHAYLFCGPPGVGRRTLALRFVQALMCERPIGAGIPCGSCENCKRFADVREPEISRHPDVSVIPPTVQDESKNFIPDIERGLLRVEQIREARRLLTLQPLQAKYRAALFLRFHKANDSAANALLKTLEESPARAILLLTADAPEQLLPTIVSRCEVLRLRPLPLGAAAADLIERGIAPERAALLAHLSGGRPGYARRLAEEPELLEKRAERLRDMQTLLPASRVQKFAYAEKLAKDKDAARETLLVWQSYWRDVMLRAAQAEAPLTNADWLSEIEFLAGRMELAAARRVVSELDSALEKLERNVNPRLLLEVLLLNLPKV